MSILVNVVRSKSPSSLFGTDKNFQYILNFFHSKFIVRFSKKSIFFTFRKIILIKNTVESNYIG